MADTHDYTTKPVKGKDLTGEHVLVGESGGLSAIYDSKPSSLVLGMQMVETEHGALMLDPDHDYEVFAG